MLCPKCLYDNSTSARFCNQCAASLMQTSSRDATAHGFASWWASKPQGVKVAVAGSSFLGVIGLLLIVTLISKDVSTKDYGSAAYSQPEQSQSSTTPNAPAFTKKQATEKLFALIGTIISTEIGEKETPVTIRTTTELITRYGADVNARNQLGETPLIMAARNGHIEKIKVLLDHGADINSQGSEDGKTALIWAAHMNDADMTKLLLDKGANPNLKDRDGYTARTGAIQIDENASTGDPAHDRRYKEVMKLLRKVERK